MREVECLREKKVGRVEGVLIYRERAREKPKRKERKIKFLEGKLKEKRERCGFKLGNSYFLKEKKVILHSKGFNFQLIISEGLVRSSQSIYNK